MGRSPDHFKLKKMGRSPSLIDAKQLKDGPTVPPNWLKKGDRQPRTSTRV